MNRFTRLTIAVASVASLAVPASASASYMMTRDQARDFANSEISTRYQNLGVPDSGGRQTCRPQTSKVNQVSGSHAHRWVCSWKANTYRDSSCVGKVLIVGSAADVNNTYYRAILQPARCTK